MKNVELLHLLEKVTLGFTNLTKNYKKDWFLELDYYNLVVKDFEELAKIIKYYC